MAEEKSQGGGMGGFAGPIAGLIGLGLNNAFASDQNRKSRAWEDKNWQRDWQDKWDRYYQERSDDRKILEDQRAYDERIWNMQNTYNERMRDEQRIYDSPQKQMERLKAAGLNPNLIYGQMDGGSPSISGSSFDSHTQSDASNQAASVSRSAQFTPMSVGDFNPVVTMLDTELKKAQIGTTRATQQAIETKSALDTLKQGTETMKQTGIDMDNVKKQMYLNTYDKILNYSTRAMDLSNQKTTQEMQINKHNDNRATIRLNADLKKIYEETKNMSEERKLKIIEQALRKAQKQGVDMENYIRYEAPKDITEDGTEQGTKDMEQFRNMLYKVGSTIISL